MDTEGTGRGFLRATEGPVQDEKFLIRDRMVFGRAEDCDACLADASISRQHFRLHVRGNEVRIEDLGSGNGVKVNGRFVTTAVLNPGDRIEIGDTVLVSEFPTGRRRAGGRLLLVASGVMVVVVAAVLLLSMRGPGRAKQVKRLKAQAAAAGSAGRYAEAMLVFQQLIPLEPRNPEWPRKVDEMGRRSRISDRVAKVLFAARAGAFEHALETLDELEREFPGDVDVASARQAVTDAQADNELELRIMKMVRDEKYDPALQLLDSANQAAGDDRHKPRIVNVMLSKASSLDRHQNRSGALAVVNEALALDSANEAALRMQAELTAPGAEKTKEGR